MNRIDQQQIVHGFDDLARSGRTTKHNIAAHAIQIRFQSVELILFGPNGYQQGSTLSCCPTSGHWRINQHNSLCLKLHGKLARPLKVARRSEEHTSELQSLMRNSYAVFCLIKT